MAEEPQHQSQAQSEPRREPPVIEGEAIRTEETARNRDLRPSRLPLGLALLLGIGGTALGVQGLWDSMNADQERQTLRESVAQLQARPVASAPNLAAAPELKELQQRLAALEQKPQPASPEPAIAALTQRVDQLDRALVDLQDAAKALTAPTQQGETPSIDLSPVLAQLRALDQRMSAIERDVKTLNEKPREPVPAAEIKNDTATSLVVVAQSIVQHVEQAQPLTTLLDLAQKLGASPQRLAALREATSNGLASTSSLTQSWQKSSRAVLDALQDKPTADGTIMDRLKASASQLVRVRPVGEVLGEDAASLMARIDASLAQGAVAQAYAAWEKLPDAAKAASKSFGDLAQKRVAAEQAARALAESAMQALTTKAAP